MITSMAKAEKVYHQQGDTRRTQNNSTCSMAQNNNTVKPNFWTADKEKIEKMWQDAEKLAHTIAPLDREGLLRELRIHTDKRQALLKDYNNNTHAVRDDWDEIAKEFRACEQISAQLNLHKNGDRTASPF